MSVAAFLDTNILLYAISTAPAERSKKQIARGILANGGYGLSAQVLQEFYANATRPPKGAMSHRDAAEAVREFASAPLAGTDMALIEKAFSIQSRYGVSYWDAAIIAAASALGAGTLFSEDLEHGQTYAGVRVVNPFVE